MDRRRDYEKIIINFLVSNALCLDTRSNILKGGLIMVREPMKNCFAYNKKAKTCDILDDLYCTSETCKFYKTRKEFEEQNGGYITRKD